VATIQAVGMNALAQKILDGFTGWFGNGPWRSKSVLAALAVVVVGLGFWISDIKTKPQQNKTEQTTTDAPKITPLDSGSHWNWSKPFPFYVRMGASYAAAYCLGWLFRRVLRLILVVSVLAIAVLAYGRFAGWDMTRTQEKVTHSSEWARHTATAEKDHLKHLLPSATAGAAGMFMGFWRRSQTRVAHPVA
jgi:uncharacterized membrane protein (Fun14 family)